MKFCTMLLSTLDEHFFCKNHTITISLKQGILILPFRMKFSSREIYFIIEPGNLIPTNMHTLFSTKTDKILT